MRNYIIILLSVYLLISATVSYTQQKSPDKKSSGFEKGIVLSLGAGKTIYRGHFVLSPVIIWELHEHINVAAGADIYFPTEYRDATFSINLLPYYKLKAGIFNFRIGAGIAFWDGHILAFPSIRLDFEFLKNNFLGAEVKSLLPIPIGADRGPPFIPILVNYSIKF